LDNAGFTTATRLFDPPTPLLQTLVLQSSTDPAKAPGAMTVSSPIWNINLLV
jgi:hypothetical protein